MCGKSVSVEATACPHCGEALTPAVGLTAAQREDRRQRRIQKSLAALGLLIAVLAGLSLITPALAVGGAILFGPAAVATMVRATAVYPPERDPADSQLMVFFWKVLGWTFGITVGLPLVLVICFAAVCALS
jgi:hypothetical protein